MTSPIFSATTETLYMSMTRFVVSFNVDVLAVVHSGLIAVRPFGLFDDVTDPN
jgi:hypothetical protein